MIIWSGRGIFPVLVLITSIIVCLYVVPREYVDYGFAGSFLAAGLFSWHFGKTWNSSQRILRDEETGQRIVFKNRHTLFWIPMQYVGLIFSLIGATILFQNSLLLGTVSAIVLVVLFLMGFKKKGEKKTMGKTKKQEEKTRKVPEIDGTEKERMKREKEDPGRFMPRSNK